MFTSAAVLASVLVSVLIIASLFLKTFGSTQPVPTRGVIPSGLACEDLFEFLNSQLGTGAQFLAAGRRPANKAHGAQVAIDGAAILLDLPVAVRVVADA